MKVVVIGLGSIARKHIDAIRQLAPGTEIYALRHSPEALPEEGIVNLFSLDEAKKAGADFFLISNPTSMHRETIEQLIPAGRPLFIEKPLGNTMEFDTLEQIVQAGGLRTYVACNLRFLDSLRYLKDHLPGRRVNEVNTYCGSYLPEWRPGNEWRACYSANKEMGGGVHIDLIHEIDYLYWLFGKPAQVRKVFRNVSSLEITACDYANYCLEYGNFAASAVLNYYRRDYKRTLEIVFDTDTWLIDLAANRILDMQGKEIFRSRQTFGDTYLRQMEYFLEQVLHNESDSFNNLAQANEVLKICLDYESSR